MTYRDHGVQYWPLYRRSDSELIGSCGLHPYKSGLFELGVHLRPMFWRRVLAVCDDILAGRSDEEPFEFQGNQGLPAKACGPDGGRLDGGRGISCIE